MTEPINLPLKTGGGVQFWTDHRWCDGWRLQQHAATGHWRLLDPSDVRRAWGTREHCQRMLQERVSHQAPDSVAVLQRSGAIVVLHGLLRTHRSMRPLQRRLRDAGYPAVIRFAYASTRRSIADHAAALRELLEGLPADAPLSFVGHSMGNVVIRHLIGDLLRDGDQREILDRCRCMMMLGPPNQGASLARRLSRIGLYELLTGPGGMELGPHWEAFAERLAVPPFPFAIIAGDCSNTPLRNPLLEGPGDLIVGVEEAQLEGAEHFETVPVVHSFLMRNAEVIDKTLAFLRRHHPVVA